MCVCTTATTNEDIGRQREIKNRLSAYLRIVEQGDRVAVTRRGRVVAELGPPAPATEDDAYAELRPRVRAGTVRIGGRNRPDLYPRPSRRLPSQVVRELLDDVRRDRNATLAERRASATDASRRL